MRKSQNGIRLRSVHTIFYPKLLHADFCEYNPPEDFERFLHANCCIHLHVVHPKYLFVDCFEIGFRIRLCRYFKLNQSAFRHFPKFQIRLPDNLKRCHIQF